MKFEEEERLLRSYIKKGIELHYNKSNKSKVDEVKLRNLLRDMILQEASEKVEADPHRYTGINVLRELFRNTNLLKTLREKYKTMTTSKEQRDSFRAHILTWILGTLAPVYALDQATLNEGEDVQIDVDADATEEDEGMFLDADDGSDIKSDLIDNEEEEEDEEEEKEDYEGQEREKNWSTSLSRQLGFHWNFFRFSVTCSAEP